MKDNFTIAALVGPDALPGVVAFVRVARHGSFTRAAAEMGVTPSALSQTVRGLEQRIGLRLLNRTTRRVGLTEVGTQFLQRVLPALEQLGAAFSELDDLRGRPSGTLRITAPNAVVPIVLAPALGAFCRNYPDVQLDISIDDQLVDLIGGGFDAGIRLGERLAQDMIAVRVSERQRIAVVGSPEYFTRNPVPQQPADLHEHPCFRFRFPSGGLYRWEFEREGEALEIDVEGPLVINNNELAVAGARAGLGLAHVFEALVAEDLASGRLRRVLEDWCAPFDGFYLYYPSRAQMPLKLRVFIDFLQKQLHPE